MGKKSRDKGRLFETSIVTAHKLEGLSAQRVPLSGGAGGMFSGDVVIEGYTAECKIRAGGFKQLYQWIEPDEIDFLIVRADRQPRLYVLPEAMWFTLISCAASFLEKGDPES